MSENGKSPVGLKRAPAIPGTSLCPPLLLYNMMYRPLDFLMEAAEKHELVRLGWLGVPYYLVTGPELVKQMLSDTKRFQKGSLFKKLEIVLGKGLITLNGKAWIDARRRVNQAFDRALMSRQQAIVIRHTTGLLKRLKADASPAYDLDRLMNDVTIGVAMELLFGATAEDIDLDEFRQAVEICNDYTRYRIWSLVPETWNTARRRGFLKALAALNAVVASVIERRSQDTRSRRFERCDVLSLLLDAGFDGAQLRDHVMTMLLAGHETTAGAATFLLGLLSRHPRVQDDLYAELSVVPEDEVPLDDLPLTEAAWREALRIYPSVPMLDRKAHTDVRLGDYQIAAGSNLIWSPYVMHRKYFAEPEAFLPGRFLRGMGPKPGTYIPFGEGPRMCIGKALADMEGKTIVAMLAREFTMEQAAEEPLSVRPLISLRPERGFRVRFHPRRTAGELAQSAGCEQRPRQAMIEAGLHGV